MSALDDARAEVLRLEREAEFEQALTDAGAAYEADPSQEKLAAHNTAAEALVEHRAQNRTEGGPRIGGDATVAQEAE